jgi:hypothetical protein
MKPSRRHELKTNELSIFLQQVYASAKQNLNYVIGGVVVVVAILAVGLYIQHRRQATHENAWKQYEDLRTQVGRSGPNPSLLQSAATLAAEQEGSGDLGRPTAALAADIAFELAASLDPVKDKAKRLELLKEARSRYQGMTDRYSDDPDTAAAARFSLANIEESLLMAGESTKEKVLALYEPLTKAELGTYKTLAEEQIKTLDERIQPLQIVATRPAEPPATAPSPLTPTRPTTVQPEMPGTQPAPVAPLAPTMTQPNTPTPTQPVP